MKVAFSHSDVKKWRSKNVIQRFAEALAKNSSLTKLSLLQSKGVRGNKALKELAAALSLRSSLSDLHLSFTRLYEEGAVALANTLAENSSLSKLSFRSNKVGKAGLKALAAALLGSNSSLSELHLLIYQFGDVGVMHLVDALVSNRKSSLPTLDFK